MHVAVLYDEDFKYGVNLFWIRVSACSNIRLTEFEFNPPQLMPSRPEPTTHANDTTPIVAAASVISITRVVLVLVVVVVVVVARTRTDASPSPSPPAAPYVAPACVAMCARRDLTHQPTARRCWPRRAPAPAPATSTHHRLQHQYTMYLHSRVFLSFFEALFFKKTVIAHVRTLGPVATARLARGRP